MMRWICDPFIKKMARPCPQQVEISGRFLRPGNRVRLRPVLRGDAIDHFLEGRTAVIEGIDEDDAGVVHVSVVLEDDPGRDLGNARHPAHRFFFLPGDLEPLDIRAGESRRVLVAGIGNVFLGDDGFGVAVARRLMERRQPPWMQVADFGIRGLDLAFSLAGGCHAAILVDAVSLGRPPGTVIIMKPDADFGQDVPLDSHRMEPHNVLRMARQLGPLPGQLFIVGCEPGPVLCGDAPDSMSMEMSAPVAAAIEKAAEMVTDLADRLIAGSYT